MKVTKEAVEAIKALEDSRGRLTHEDVVSAARSESSPLHGYFNWNDTEAAHQHRLEQARDLIKRVKLVVVVEEKMYRAVSYVRDPRKEVGSAGYVSVVKINKQTAVGVMRQELRGIVADMDRAINLARAKRKEVPGLTKKIAKLRNQVAALADSL